MTKDEIAVLDIEDIQTRSNEIRKQMTAENADEFAEEIGWLEERKAVVKAEIEQRKAEIEAVKDIKTEEKIEERKEMTFEEIRSSKEYVDAFANYLKTEDPAECRALLSENASGTVAVPTLVEDIVRTAWEREGIMSRVRKAYIKGNLKVGFEISATGAVVHTEGAAAPSEETLVLGTVSIVPASIKKWITVSDEALDLRGEAFLRYIYDELTYQIAKKAADQLIVLIEAAGTASTTTAVGIPKVTVASLSMDTIAQAVAHLSDEASDPVIMMNKLTYAAFKKVQYDNGYGADPFEGLPVLFNNTITAYSAATTGVTYAIVGDLGRGALANFPAGEEINIKFDDLSLAEKDLVKIVGREYVGLGIVGPGCFVKVTH